MPPPAQKAQHRGGLAGIAWLAEHTAPVGDDGVGGKYGRIGLEGRGRHGLRPRQPPRHALRASPSARIFVNIRGDCLETRTQVNEQLAAPGRRRRQNEASFGLRPLRQGSARLATHSMWYVWGNMSTGVTPSNR